MVPSPLGEPELHYPEEWFEELSSNDMTFYYEFETLRNTSVIKSESFKHFLDTCHSLSQVQSYDYESVPNIKMKGDQLKGLNGKKLHEISVIEHYMGRQEPKVHKIIEIGGGKGNLSYVLCVRQDIQGLSIDLEQSFQDSGKKRNDRFLGEKKDMIKFCNHKLDDGELPENFESYDMSIGLHTCGGLSRI